jgi:type III pantothenate kinase
MNSKSPVLQLDVGNSAAKWRLVCEQGVLARGRCGPNQIDSLAKLMPQGATPGAIWVASVAAATLNAQLASELEALFDIAPWFAQTQAQTGGLANSYAEPGRMGVDRWLAMLGARARVDGALCVVDVGSATTIDLVSADGQHEGGYIIPGPALMERALLLDTDRVRFDDEIGYALSPGRSTAEAVRHGIALAQIGAITAIHDISQRTVVVTGGGAQALSALLAIDHSLVPDLVFEGLEVMAAEDLLPDGR